MSVTGAVPSDMRPTIEAAEALLAQRFGFPCFRASQRRAVSAVLAGRDVLAVMPTGGGKSLCFQVPALLLDGLTVVLSPLVSLMKDQVDTLLRRGLPAVALHGGMTGGEQADALSRAIHGEAKLLYVAPERLVTGATLQTLSRLRVSLLAVDEAHCISEWGHEFRPSYRALQSMRSTLGSPPVIALTATATPAVRDDIARVCGLRTPVRVVAGFDRPNLRYVVHRVSRAADRDHQIQRRVPVRDGASIVYAASRARVERIAASLARVGVPAAAYHAGQAPELRRVTQERFMAGVITTIVATSAFGMGVDKANVRVVVHDAMPGSLESYYQEAGRAGRDSAAAECVLLYARGDRRSPEYFIQSAAPARQVIERAYESALAIGAGGAPIDATAAASHAKLSRGQIRGAFAILVRAGALRDELGDPGAIWVRLLASAARIRETCAPGSLERDLLRALWSSSRGAIASGASLPHSALPPGLGEVGLASALDALMRASMLVWRRPRSGLVIANAAVSSHQIRVDWASVAEHRRSALSRLSAMIRYAEARTCRREVVLGYFGDGLNGRRCAGCDCCDRCDSGRA